jgi:hypothetical protein
MVQSKAQPEHEPTDRMGRSFQRWPMDGAKIKHTYTPMGNKTKVELKGDFRAMPGLAESAQLKMIGDFFTISFNEDNANLQKMK